MHDFICSLRYKYGITDLFIFLVIKITQLIDYTRKMYFNRSLYLRFNFRL